MTKIATLALYPPFQVTMVQSCIRKNQQFTPSPITQAFSFPKSMRPIRQKSTDDKSIDEAINEAANNSTHSVPPSTEIQLTQTDKHPLVQAVKVRKQTVHTTAKSTFRRRARSRKSCQRHRPRHPHRCHSSKKLHGIPSLTSKQYSSSSNSSRRHTACGGNA